MRFALEILNESSIESVIYLLTSNKSSPISPSSGAPPRGHAVTRPELSVATTIWLGIVVILCKLAPAVVRVYLWTHLQDPLHRDGEPCGLLDSTSQCDHIYS